jgi:uncharacterized protein
VTTTHGKFIWYDVMTGDCKAAEAFYRRVIGWDAKDSGMADSSYTLFSVGATMVAGLMPIPEEARKSGARPCWTGYIAVDDVDAYATRVKEAGGSVHRAPADIPGVGRFAVVADPHGAVFTLFRGSSEQAPEPAAPGTHLAMSAGMNCTPATEKARSLSMPVYSVGPEPRPSIWARWASIKPSRRAARRLAA